MNVDEILTELKRRAGADPELRGALLATASSDHPLREFCEIARNLGYSLYEMDLLNAGEEYYANMRRSTNGGGENSPMLSGEDDYYELFLAELGKKWDT